MPSSGNQPVSPLVVQEYLAAADARFVDAIRQVTDPKALASIAEKWKRDHRPWAREQIVRYLNQPMDTPGHEPVIKRLFKHFEEQHDDEMMAEFLVVFDRTVRRVRRKRMQYDAQARQSWHEEYLYAPRNTMPRVGKGVRVGQHPKTLAPIIIGRWTPPNPRLFTYHTRYYLRRRAWRYFRHAAFTRPEQYPNLIARALAKYRDDDLKTGENLLDCWSLMHACFGESNVITFDAAHARLRDGRSLAELRAAPSFSERWQRPGSGMVLVRLVSEAHSRAVRTWAIQLVTENFRTGVPGLTLDEALRLLDHADAEVQQLGATLLEHIDGLEFLPTDQWLRLLETRNTLALETIAALMLKHARPEQLTLEQLVRLAAAEPAPVARLGLTMLGGRPVGEADLETVSLLANGRCEALGRELALWALGTLGTAHRYDVERVSRFFDSLNHAVRGGAWEWLSPASRGWDDPALWSRLFESPYDDIRLRLIAAIEHRLRLPGASADDLSNLWLSILLSIHRGGRAKLTALRQLSAALKVQPDRAGALLPVLAVALRSVRLPEARGALAAVIGAVESNPELSGVVARYLPELQISPEAAAT